jgi:hypothetical protein
MFINISVHKVLVRTTHLAPLLGTAAGPGSVGFSFKCGKDSGLADALGSPAEGTSRKGILYHQVQATERCQVGMAVKIGPLLILVDKILKYKLHIGPVTWLLRRDDESGVNMVVSESPFLSSIPSGLPSFPTVRVYQCISCFHSKLV